jgi:phenylalanyl-tRNA synthetase alpha chain
VQFVPYGANILFILRGFNVKEKLETIKNEALLKIGKAADMKALEEIRIGYLGKKGALTGILRGMGSLSEEERPAAGKLANEVREAIESALKSKKDAFEDALLKEKLSAQSIDISLDNRKFPVGHHHPLYKTIKEVTDIFLSMGFSVAEGPEIEWVKYNFDNLNVPLDHSSRDESDTFYCTQDIVLRTQTSPVQIRTMLGAKPPIKIISPGKVYRRDEIDATHSPMFHQLEGLVIDKGITMSDLKGTLDYIAKRLYGAETKTIFRPHQFYFTEPSAEMDATCFVCKGKGCRVCKGSGFIEILGCGMVHPNVLEGCGIDPDEYSGFAFGLGLDRMAMLKYAIPDLRYMYGNDTEFLMQF